MGVRAVVLVHSRLVGGRDGMGLWKDGIGGFWTGKMRSHCGMEGGGVGNVVPVRGQHEGKGSFLPGRIPHL